jgi:hypothetical protein
MSWQKARQRLEKQARSFRLCLQIGFWDSEKNLMRAGTWFFCRKYIPRFCQKASCPNLVSNELIFSLSNEFRWRFTRTLNRIDLLEENFEILMVKNRCEGFKAYTTQLVKDGKNWSVFIIDANSILEWSNQWPWFLFNCVTLEISLVLPQQFLSFLKYVS